LPSRLADMVAANLNISPAEKQQILEELNVNERLKKVTFFVTRELEILETGHKIQDQIKSQMDKGQREYFLREQLKAIQKELGEVDEKTVEMNEIREKLKAAQLPPEAMKEAERELDRLTKMPPQAAEYTVARSYLDWLAALPWKASSTDNLDIAQAEKILNEDHFDLEKVKKRILEYLSVRKLKDDMKGPILCFVGPPGVGKTSLGQSIARALGRKFVRFSLGGMRDEAEIRGHRRTYIGALPGRIIKEIRRAETNNPVFMLDEVDKIGMDFRGDPASALLEVLDPQQNNTFQDNYLDIAFDLSKVLWITTANVLHTIPAPLRDRMEIIEIAGYSEHDKLGIARKYLVPRQLKEHGIKAEMAEFTDEALADIIRYYTREAGIRNLEREIANIMRSIASGIARGGTQKIVINIDEVRKALGHKRFLSEEAFKEDEVGVTTGLAWTEVGGDILFVESSLNPGRGALILTGQLGNVMQESARAALTCARTYLRRTKYKLPRDFFNVTDIHIHVPAGAIPKDGPSAGITMAASLISAITGKPVRRDVAMTGEITLRGKVLPIGGVKEKVLAAHRAGIKKVILPEENRKDIEDVTKDVREAMSFDFVQTIDQVLKIALKEAKKGKAKR
jgi:ATP-dependent Lon protease